MLFIIPICLLSVFGHVDSMSLVDLVKQSAAKLNPHFSKALPEKGTETINRQSSAIQVPTSASLRQEGISQIDPTLQTVRRTSHADPISVLPEQMPFKAKVNEGHASETTVPTDSILKAADLVLQYIQLTPNFKSVHGLVTGSDTSSAKTAAREEPVGHPITIDAKQKVKFEDPPKSAQGGTKEQLSPEQQLALLLSVADEIKKIGTPGSGITLEESIKLLMELAPNASLPLKGPSLPLDQIQQIMQPKGAKTDSTCGGHCPPKWINIVDFFSHLVSPGSEMCHFYQTMELQSCDTPNTACKPGYTCCSSTCLNKIVVCDPWYPHKVPDHICLPKDVSNWWPEVHNTLPHIIGHGVSRKRKGSTNRSTTPT